MVVTPKLSQILGIIILKGLTSKTIRINKTTISKARNFPIRQPLNRHLSTNNLSLIPGIILSTNNLNNST